MIAWGVLLAALTAAAPEDNPHLARAIGQVQRLEERAALQSLEEARRWPGNTPAILARVYLYMGLAHAGLADEPRAVESFETALKLDRALELPPHMSPTVVEWWRRAQERVPRPVEPPTTAAPSSPEVPSAAMPPAGTTLAQPPDVITGADLRRWSGYALVAAGAATLATGTYFGWRAQSLARAAEDEPFAAPAQARQEDANANARTANLLFIGGGLAAGAGVALWLSGTF